MVTKNWKRVLGEQLAKFRKEANNGKGFSHIEVARATKLSRSYIIQLETHMEQSSVSLPTLEQLCIVYGRHPGELFEPIVPTREITWAADELHKKLDVILGGPERTKIAIIENIEGMYLSATRKKQ